MFGLPSKPYVVKGSRPSADFLVLLLVLDSEGRALPESHKIQRSMNYSQIQI